MGKPAFVERENKCGIGEAIKAIKKAGGLSLLAHPGIFAREQSIKLIDFFKKQQGDGIETYYPYHVLCPQFRIGEKENLEMIKFYQGIAENEGLLESGGSDFHGGDRETINVVSVPDTVLDKLKNAHRT